MRPTGIRTYNSICTQSLTHAHTQKPQIRRSINFILIKNADLRTWGLPTDLLLSQLGIKFRHTTFLNFIKLANYLIVRLKNCKMAGRVLNVWNVQTGMIDTHVRTTSVVSNYTQRPCIYFSIIILVTNTLSSASSISWPRILQSSSPKICQSAKSVLFRTAERQIVSLWNYEIIGRNIPGYQILAWHWFDVLAS